MLNLNNSFIPFFSVIVSILFFLGTHYIGKIVVNTLKIKNHIATISNINYQSSSIGIIFISYLIYPIVINNFFSLKLVKFFSYLIIFLGFLFLLNFIKKKYFKIRKLEITTIIISIFFIFYFLVSIGPITNADSIDYHIGVPYNIINNETYPNYKYWFHLIKSGAGEIFYTLPLSIYAINVPGLTQLAGLLSITGIILKKNNFSSNKKNFNLLLIFLSCPVLIFLVTSAKPQLIYVGMSSLVFALLFFGDRVQFKNNHFIIFISILLTTNMVGKYSFTLSSGLLLITTLYFAFHNKNFLNSILIISFVVSIIFLSKSNYLIQSYDLNFFQTFINPIPLNLPGYKQLYTSLTSCGYNGCFPYWVVIPKDISSFTESLGIGGILILIIKITKNKFYKFALFVTIIQIVFSSIFGPNNARWYLEPFIWGLILTKYSNFRFLALERIFYFFAKIQIFVILIILLYSTYSLTPGSFSKSKYNEIMNKNTDGYSLFNWSNSLLNKNDILISTHRSFALSNVLTIPGDLFMYIDFKDKNNSIYFEEIKKLKPNYILFYGQKNNFDKFENCIGNQVYYKKNVGKKGARNPFNREENNYDGYLYKFNYEKLPNCLIKN